MPNKKMKHVWMVEDTTSVATKEQRSYWTKIGVAYENEDGSWSLQLSAVPVTGKMQIRDAAPLPAAQPAQPTASKKAGGAR